MNNENCSCHCHRDLLGAGCRCIKNCPHCNPYYDKATASLLADMAMQMELAEEMGVVEENERYNQLKDRFYSTYTNVPLSERRNAIYVDDVYGPTSWWVVKIEVDAITEFAKRALSALASMEII